MSAEPHNRDNGQLAADGSSAERSAAEVVRLLSDPASYAERPARVTLRETHISCVFLTDQYAYKLKKPVAFEFLDFRSVEARRRACEDEVRLNRRLARDVYLGVVPVTRGVSGRLRIGVDDRRRRRGLPPATGAALPAPALDWLVKMRRLPDDRMLDQLIESGRLRPGEIERLAEVLVRFYDAAPPLLLEPARYRAEIERHVRANRAELLAATHALPAHVIRRVHAAQLLFLTACPEVLAARVCDGRVIDGHGDLRPEHVCLLNTPVVFDCLEFSPELQRLDVLDELGFFAMECDMLGADFVGRRVLQCYSDHSGDRPPERLLWFYQCYRACVRAKVAALRAAQLTGSTAEAARDHARRYLTLADDYARRLSPPLVIVTRGLSGSGKTTLSKRLAETLGVARLATDDARREMFDDPRSAAFGARYSEAGRRAVYEEVFRRCQELLDRGESAVLDGTFLAADLLRRAAELAQAHQARLLALTCHCPPEVAQARIAARLSAGQDTSEVRPEQRREQEASMERVPEGISAFEVETSAGVHTDRLADFLRPLMTSDRLVGIAAMCR